MTENDLTFLLIRAEAGNDVALQSWLKATPKHQANDLLFRTVTAGWPSPMPLWRMYFSYVVVSAVVVGVLLYSGAAQPGGSLYQAPWIFFLSLFMALPLLFTGMIHAQICAAREGRYGVFTLLERQDRRAVPLLISVWQGAVRSSDTAWKEKTTATLAEALDGSAAPPDDDLQNRLRTLVKDFLLPSRFRRIRDLNESEMDILVSALRYLHRAQGSENPAFISRIAALPRSEAQPNRALVCEIAENLVAPHKAQSSPSATTTQTESVSGAPVDAVAPVTATAATPTTTPAQVQIGQSF